MPDLLTDMAGLSAFRAREVASAADASDLEARVASAPPARPLRLSETGFDVLAEAKLATPADGVLARGGVSKVVELGKAYADAGAVAISVLTEETRFGGSISHLDAVVAATEKPVMRKDFLVDPIQILESRAHGASGVLLIARILSGRRLVEMTEQALDLGMFVVVEVFDERDLEAAVDVFSQDVLVGVNCRDLATLGVDLGRFEDLVSYLPKDRPWVAESGVHTETDIALVAGLGYRLALIGSALVTSPDPTVALRRLLDCGRTALAEAPA